MNRNRSNVVPLPVEGKARKSDHLNQQKSGSVRKINGRIYMDFNYFDQRVRENTGLLWSDKAARQVREDLDEIIRDLTQGRRRFHEIFPGSAKHDYFRDREEKAFKFTKKPGDVKIGDEIDSWYQTRKGAMRVSGRTLFGQKSHIDNYIRPFFGELTFGELGKALFEKYVAWARALALIGKTASNTTINKSLIPLRMIGKDVASEHGWTATFNPFADWVKLPEPDPWELIFPFSIDEQMLVRAALPAHWVPFFDFAFRVGPRQGEQIALRPADINWQAGTVSIRRAVTLNEEGKRVEGPTKNKYSRRTIKLNPVMLAPLETQKKIHEKTGGEYFFCTERGTPIDLSDLRRDVWIPALRAAHIDYRAMRQTRHSFATNALLYGENALWIATVLGHRNTDMVIKTYTKYIERLGGTPDGGGLASVYEEAVRG